MTLTGLAAAALIPPVNLAVLAAVLLVAARPRLALATLMALLLLALPAVADALLAPLELAGPASDPANAQAIVVLGGEVAQGADGRTVPGLLTSERLRLAAGLARRTGLPILVTGGVTRDGAAPVATAMAESLRNDFGVPPRWVEDQSANTLENARQSAALLAGSGVNRVLLVTQPWHMRRALLAFSATNLRAEPAPVGDAARRKFEPADIIPSPEAWLRSYDALHEWLGLAWYALRIRL